MASTLERLMQHHGPEAKAVVWEHNTHIGDARATDMARAGMVNVGQLVRERHPGGDVVLIGFAGHRGSVIAGREWGAPPERLAVPEAADGSWDDLLHRVGTENKLLIFDRDEAVLHEPRGHRAIGVVYDPLDEFRRNYAPSLLSLRYDALIYLDETRALHPLHLPAVPRGEPPATYPWGV
jgi:erythromycin esterase-like protein